VILADEPTGNLDSHSSEEVLDLLDDLNRKGVTIIMVTHEHDVALRAHRIIWVHDGKVIEKAGETGSILTGIGQLEEAAQ